MAMVDLGKAKKILSQTFLEENESIGAEAAAQLIVKAEQSKKSLIEERDTNEHLQAAKQVVKDLSAGYNTAVAYEEAKIRFLLEKLEEIEGEGAI